MKKKLIKSIKHETEKRLHIPSAEEAGYEGGSARVKQTPTPRKFDLNPIVHRGQDPELNWLDKYISSDLRVPVRSLYRHEHVGPEEIIKGLYRIVEDTPDPQGELYGPGAMFGNMVTREELDKVGSYYTGQDEWKNRLIQGDSLLVMTSLLELEGMSGKVQCIYIDPPYGIKYNSNWQIKLNSRAVVDGQDESLTGEPEQIKAFRDTYRLGVHSYLSYLRDRLLVAVQLLHDTGSCFVQISDENVHLVRCLMDEVFGSSNFIGQITFKKTGGQSSSKIAGIADYLLWYGKQAGVTKYRPLFQTKTPGQVGATQYDWLELPDGSRRRMTPAERDGRIPDGAKVFQLYPLVSPGEASSDQTFIWEGKQYKPSGGGHWKVSVDGLRSLAMKRRLIAIGKTLRYINYLDDFPVTPITNIWNDTQTSGFASDRWYVVQTLRMVIERCILMTTDPGDLVLDPTCGSGTSALVAEEWGRRWVTIDTSRIALNIAKTRLMTSIFPFYSLYDSEEGAAIMRSGKAAPGKHDALANPKTPKPTATGYDIRFGFLYEKARHLTASGVAYDEPDADEVLYDRPLVEKNYLRVAGPFTVETLQSYEPTSPEELARQREDIEDLAAFEDLIFAHLKSAGVRTGIKEEKAVFTRIDRLSTPELHAEGYYPVVNGKTVERKAYLYIGPKFGTVSKQAVNEAIKACRRKRDGDWLMILGFAFESNLSEVTTQDFGSFKASLIRMHDDLLQEGLLKNAKDAASFVTIGEPDIRLHCEQDIATVEIAGLDIYDPIKDVVKSRDVHDIAYWMLDTDYDGSSFVVRQVYFCGGDKDEFDGWKRKLSDLATAKRKRDVEQTLKIEIDDEAFASAYGHTSRQFPVKAGQKIAVRIISQFGEETTKILPVAKSTKIRT